MTPLQLGVALYHIQAFHHYIPPQNYTAQPESYPYFFHPQLDLTYISPCSVWLRIEAKTCMEFGDMPKLDLLNNTIVG